MEELNVACILDEGPGLQNTKYLWKLHHFTTACNLERMSDTIHMNPFSWSLNRSPGPPCFCGVLFIWSTLQYMHTCTVGFCAGEAPRKNITMRIYTDGSFSVCSGVKGKEGWGWGSTCCGPGNIRMRMFELVPVRLFCGLRMAEHYLIYLQIELLIKTSDPQERPSEEEQELKHAGLEHRVRQVKMCKTKRGNSISIPQTPTSFTWLGAALAQIQSETQPLCLVQQNSSQFARMHLVWCGSGTLALAEDTNICRSVSTFLLLGTIFLDIWCSSGALVLLAVIAAPPFIFQECGLSTSSFTVKRGIFIETQSLSLSNVSGVGTWIIFMSEVGRHRRCFLEHRSRPVGRG